MVNALVSLTWTWKKLYEICAQLWLFGKKSRISFSITICVWFFKKSISHVIFIKFHCLVAFNFWDIAQYVYCNCFPVDDVVNFKMNLSFLIKPFSCKTKKCQGKKILRTEFLNEIKVFFIIFKGFSSIARKFSLI